MSSTRVLILRLSSFGDIVQTLPSVDILLQQNIKIDFYTKPEFKYIVDPHPAIQNTYYFDKKKSLWSQVAEFKILLKQNQYDVIYDAHSNNRTYLLRLLTFGLRFSLNLQSKIHSNHKPKGFSETTEPRHLKWIRRPKYRLRRLLYFKFKLRNVFPNPMIAAQSFLDPLIKNNIITKSAVLPININTDYNLNILNRKPTNLNPEKNDINILQKEEYLNLQTWQSRDHITLAPSAAWPLKRWPTTYFQELVALRPNSKFVVLGGPSDDFAKVIQGPNVINLVGQLSWGETGKWILTSKSLVSADTGVLHWADYMGVKTIGILGPTAFGQPFRPSTKVLNQNLACSPCTKDGRGKCKIKETQKCLKDIKPNDVAFLLDKLISTSKNKIY